jgi:hypothetical protein
MTKLSLLADVPDDECRLLLQQIAELIATAERLDLPDSVHLLNMAYLDLQTKIHDINDEELGGIFANHPLIHRTSLKESAMSEGCADAHGSDYFRAQGW